ncbi:MAG: O-antigen ligase family protein [Nostoc desertorum CM1-VF14]|jgi:hypothetical protein|nr:O-antigen ligase family protein [Nostoc desertorum CM1-VF14]
METIFLSVFIIVIFFLIPSNLILIVFVPISLILSNSNLVPSLYNSGNDSDGVNVRIQDILILLVFVRIIISNYQNRLTIKISALSSNIKLDNTISKNLVFNFQKIIIIFWSVLLVATTLSYYRFGEKVFYAEIFSLFRFSTQIISFFMIFYLSSKDKKLYDYYKYLDIIGYAILLSAYISFILYIFFGITFGDVQETQNTIRFFGPIGDSIGFIISLFCFKQLISGQLILASLSATIVFLSATRGAIISLIVGFLVAFLMQKNKYKFNIKHIKIILFSTTILIVFLLVLYLSDFGQVLFESLLQNLSVVNDRFTNPKIAELGLVQRQASMNLAFQVFIDNLLTGVGYTGFRFIAPEYEDYKYIVNEINASNAVATANNQYLQSATDAGFLGLLTFLIFIANSLKLLKQSSKCLSPKLGSYFMATRIWLWSLLIGNQGAAWMLPSSLISFLLWIILAIAAASVINKSTIKDVFE